METILIKVLVSNGCLKRQFPPNITAVIHSWKNGIVPTYPGDGGCHYNLSCRRSLIIRQFTSCQCNNASHRVCWVDATKEYSTIYWLLLSLHLSYLALHSSSSDPGSPMHLLSAMVFAWLDPDRVGWHCHIVILFVTWRELKNYTIIIQGHILTRYRHFNIWLLSRRSVQSTAVVQKLYWFCLMMHA